MEAIAKKKVMIFMNTIIVRMIMMMIGYDGYDDC